MTISSLTRKAGPFLGAGSAATFPFAFKVFVKTDLLVVTVDADGVETTLTLDSDYAVVLNADQDASPGGTVTLTAGPLATGLSLVIASNVPELQETEITNLGGFYPEVITASLDKLTILVQQLQAQVDRCLKLPVTDAALSPQLPTAIARANKILYFASDGSIDVLAEAPVGMSLFSGNLLGTKDGVNTVFTMTHNGTPLTSTPAQATVWDNFPLVAGVGYTLGPSAGQVTFTTAPDANDTLFAQGVI